MAFYNRRDVEERLGHLVFKRHPVFNSHYHHLLAVILLESITSASLNLLTYKKVMVVIFILCAEMLT